LAGCHWAGCRQAGCHWAGCRQAGCRQADHWAADLTDAVASVQRWSAPLAFAAH
jgi:hypothetical protein